MNFIEIIQFSDLRLKSLNEIVSSFITKCNKYCAVNLSKMKSQSEGIRFVMRFL